jgi:predicted HicB family RNase H-like nuclease
MNDLSKQPLVAVQHRIPVAVKEWLAQQARAQERSANWLVCKVLTEAMTASQSKGALQ